MKYDIKPLQSLLLDEDDIISKMANTSAYIYQVMEDVNWVGFYIVREDVLKVGPFQGRVACSTIKKGKGVCGTCWSRLETIVVDDVHKFEGHIACDVRSRSEIVIPILKKGEMIALLDVDSPNIKRFLDEERLFLEDCARLI